MDKNLLAEKKEWNSVLFELALQQILKEESSNFEHLIIKRENNEKLYQEVYDLLIMGNTKSFNKVLGKFQEFMKVRGGHPQHSTQDQNFLERNARLLASKVGSLFKTYYQWKGF